MTSAPITVTTSRRARPGTHADLSGWLSEGTALVQVFPGFLGSGWLQPTREDESWHALYRFTDAQALQRWERSPERERWLADAEHLVEDTASSRRTGLEGWFAAEPAGQAPPPAPPRWKQAVTIWLGFFPTSLLAGYLLLPHLTGLSVLLRTLVATLCLTPVMVFLVLPRITGALGWWLGGQPPPWRR